MLVIRNKALPAAYQGQGWQPRQSSLAQEISEGKIWSHYRSNSEWGSIKAVLLHIPACNTSAVEDVNSIQHLYPIDYDMMYKQMMQLCDLYHQLGIEVLLITPSTNKAHYRGKYFYNLMYVRDLFFMTPEGAILARMASTVRAGEELFVARTLAKLGIPIIRTISGTGTFG